MTQEVSKLELALKYLNENKGERITQSNSFHPSHVACKMLQEANEIFELDYYGVEGWSLDSGKKGVNYLNSGDPYVPTIFALADFESIEFKIDAMENVLDSDWGVS